MLTLGYDISEGCIDIHLKGWSFDSSMVSLRPVVESGVMDGSYKNSIINVIISKSGLVFPSSQSAGSREASLKMSNSHSFQYLGWIKGKSTGVWTSKLKPQQ